MASRRMKKKIVVCGDSFAYGIGCVNLYTQPFGVLVAQHFDWDLVRLARGSASNYSIFLQGLFAADMAELPHLVILSKTSYDRIEWYRDDLPDNKPTHAHSVLNLNYHQYPPHHQAQMHHDEPMPFHLQDSPLYDPYILSEQVGGIDHCLEVRKQHGKTKYYSRMDTEPTDKLQLIVDYHVKISDYSIKKNYDIGVLLQAYMYIKSKGIQCLVLTDDPTTYNKFFNAGDVIHQDWGALSLTYPDKVQSHHTSEEGHVDTANRVIQKIKDMKID
jgi:hypothetical protein